jgi:DNA replication ATP-dependent helicase Dna2
MTQVIAPHPRVVVIDTDGVPLLERQAGDAVCNPGEAAVAVAAVGVLCEGGLPASEVGVISPYRAQMALLARRLAERGLGDVEALTIDRAQGLDKTVMVVSLVRSNTQREAGRLLADWRRINVALTRAKRKLVVVGSASTVQSVPLFATLVGMARERGWLVNLDRHSFRDGDYNFASV